MCLTSHPSIRSKVTLDMPTDNPTEVRGRVLREAFFGDSEMAQWIAVFAVKSGNPSLILRNSLVGGEPAPSFRLSFKLSHAISIAASDYISDLPYSPIRPCD